MLLCVPAAEMSIRGELPIEGVRLRWRGYRWRLTGRQRRRGVTWEFVTILMLVAFILGLFVGAGMVRPRG